MSTSDDTSVKGRAVPPYEPRRRLAVGGMAEVFLAQDAMGRSVVLKRALPSVDQVFARRLSLEADALRHIDAPEVVALLDQTADSLVLEYVDGTDLARFMTWHRKRGLVLPLGVIAAITQDLLAGLRAIHEATDTHARELGLVHRDLSPGNVLLSRNGRARLTDLGVVHSGLAPSTLGRLKGTLAYMAPEQLAGHAVDARTDLYALGLLCFELLTGVDARPEDTAGLAGLLAARLEAPPNPRTLRPDLPIEWVEWLKTLMAPEPAARPTSAAQASAAFTGAWAAPPDRTALARWVADALHEAPGALDPTLDSPQRVHESVSPETIDAGPSAFAERVVAPESTPGDSPETHRRSASRTALWLALAGLAGVGFVVWRMWPSRNVGPSPQSVTLEQRIEPESLEQPSSTRSLARLPARAGVGQPRRGPAASRVRARGPAAKTPQARRDLVRTAPSVARSQLVVRGPVHVRTRGFAGLAPARLPWSGNTSIRLTASSGFRVTARVEGRRLRFGRTTPSYDVSCQGRAHGQTPTAWIPFGRSLSCQLRSGDRTVPVSFRRRVAP